MEWLLICLPIGFILLYLLWNAYTHCSRGYVRMSSKQSQPKVFAPRPISNVLKSKLKTPIIEYKSGKVIREDDDSQEVTFVSIDLDEWMRTTIGYIDELLTPKCVSRAEFLRKNIKRVPIPPDYVSLAEILCKKQKPVTPPTPWGDALQEVLTAKEHLADKLRMVMTVYEGETANAQQLDDIQKAFYKRMLGTMGQFYFVKAGIQFNSEVNVAIKQLPQAVGCEIEFKPLLAADTNRGSALANDNRPGEQPHDP